jgi:6-phosphogluconate dehydrogenase
MTDKARFGMIGLAVMGKNLALNVADHGVKVAVWNREPELTEQAVSSTSLQGSASLGELVASLERPRTLMMMIRAGAPVDAVLAELIPLLDPDDIVIDGGNSWYEDTQRREKQAREAGIRFFGMGVSGGEDGARHGPSLMPGGDRGAYEHMRPIFEAIAAKTEAGPCVTYIGPDGAGHFVKMVHNGIEYADMQCIAEAYHLLRDLGGMQPPELATVFEQYNQGPLESFLIEITGKILRVRDGESEGYLVDKVLDEAGQKGTGRWTAQVALELGVPVPSIAAAIDARVLSSMKKERVAASQLLNHHGDQSAVPAVRDLVREVHDALFASKICAYAQGMALIAAGSQKNAWSIRLAELARIWKGGCIIRARFLDVIRAAFETDPALDNLLLDPAVREVVHAAQPAWRKILSHACGRGIPVPAMSASLAYFDAYRTAALPQNLTQAQRDAFGAHTYRRSDAPELGAVHTDWLA